MHFIFHCLLFVVAVTSKSVPPPTDGLKNVFNYFIQDNGNILRNVQIAINITEDFVTSDAGRTFLLNCYNPVSDKSKVIYQQIYIESDPSTRGLFAGVQIFNRSLSSTFVNQMQIGNLSNGHIIPAGTELVIALTTDKHGALNGACFKLTIDHETSSQNIEINGADTTTKVQVVPITGFTFNIVGTLDKGSFSSGSGNIIYSAENPIVPVNAQPNGLGNALSSTIGNSVYGEMRDRKTQRLKQNFGVE